MTSTALLSVSNKIATVTLNRPKRLNAINPALLVDLHHVLSEAIADDAVEIIILHGAGKAFCAGDDLKDFDSQVGTEAETTAYVEQIQSITHLLMGQGKPVIGAIHGWAVGGGFEWVLNCDFALFGRSTKCFFPEIQLGVFVTGAVSRLLPNLVGLQKAKEMILFGDKIDADAALQLGIAHSVHDDDLLMSEAIQLAERLLTLPRHAREQVKIVLHQAIGCNLSAAMNLETKATVEGFMDPGTRARVEGRLA